MLRAAIVGLGFVGAGDQVSGDVIGQQVAHLDGTHAQGLLADERVQLAAGASRDPGRRERFTQRTGVAATYADWHEMLARERPDIVAVSTNSPYHAEVTIACAEAGARAVLCEKPIATRLADADRMVEVCRSRGTLLAINHNRRWHPMWREVKDAIRASELGPLRSIVVRWPTGRLGNVGTHMFDSIRYLMDSDAAAVSGTLDLEVAPDCRGTEYHDPGGWGIIRFQNGVRAFVDAGQANKGPGELRVIGDAGQAVLWGESASIEKRTGAPRHLVDRRDQRPSSVALAVRDIVDCLLGGGTPRSTGQDGVAALEMIIAFHVSDKRQGARVELPLRDADRQTEVRIG